MSDALKSAGLLVCSNIFMTFAWYGHLRDRSRAMTAAILTSWGVAFFEYVLQVPANHIGYRALSAFQLKIMQEAISLTVFVGFAWLWLGERFSPRYAVSFALILAAVAVAFKR